MFDPGAAFPLFLLLFVFKVSYLCPVLCYQSLASIVTKEVRVPKLITHMVPSITCYGF